MAGKTGPNHPGGRRPRDKVRQLQRRLWAAAKRATGSRFHALYDHIWRSDVLQEAWRRVRRNRGAAGVDSQSIRDVEQHGVERFLEELGTELQAGKYRPSVVRRRYIPKADGKKRPLGIPTVRDRVAQMAAKLVLEPVFEADFLPVLVRFPAKAERDDGARDPAQAGCKGRSSRAGRRHPRLLREHRPRQADEAGGRRVSDRRVLKLLRQWLEAGVMEEGTVSPTVAGTPQGGVISPLLSNIYLHVLDVLWKRHSAPLGTLVRYADDFVVMCRTARDVRAGRGARADDPGASRARAAPGEDEASGPLRRQGGLRLPRLSPAQANVRQALGAEAEASLLPASLAVAALDAAGAATREGADPEVDVTRTSARSSPT